MPANDEDQERFVDLLAYVYGAIRWQKMNTSKNPWDIFNHRVRAAAARGSIEEFVSRLCNFFGLQSLPIEAIELVPLLKPQERSLLSLAFREHIVISMRAVMRHKERKAEKEPSKKAKAKNDRNLFE